MKIGTLAMIYFDDASHGAILGSDKAKKTIDHSLKQFAHDEPLLQIRVQQFELFSMYM